MLCLCWQPPSYESIRHGIADWIYPYPYPVVTYGYATIKMPQQLKALWPYGLKALRPEGIKALRPNGLMALWPYGLKALRP